jgi:hypothetical protein
LRHHGIARLAVLALLLHLPNASFGQKLEENTDRHGEDFRDFDLPSPDPLLCRKACVEDEQCHSFTYLKPNTGPGSPQVAHCWLKSGIPAPKHDPAFVSGVVPGKRGEWLVEERTAGGIAGLVFSDVLITSNGHFSRIDDLLGKSRKGTVPQEALRKLNAAILAAKLSSWKHSDGTSGCCDQVTTTFRLEVCGPDGEWKRYSSTLYAGSSLPADMEAVLAAMKF